MFDSVAYLLQPEYTPFTVALGVMLALGAMEAIGFGLSTITDALGLDVHFADGHTHQGMPDTDADPGVLTWLGFGRVPFGVLVVTFLLVFGFAGIVQQSAWTAVLGHPIGAWPATGIALLPALAINGAVAGLLAKVLPQDETTAVDPETFVGRRAKLLDCAATPALPARALLEDEFGQHHYVSVLPHDIGELRPETEVLLVRKEGPQFWAVPVAGSAYI